MKSADPIRQRQAMTQKLERRISCEGKLTLPAVPSLLDDYTRRCAEMFAAAGRSLSAAELAELRKILEMQLKEAFSRSQRSHIVVSYQATVSNALHYVVAPQHATLEQTYESWVSSRKPPYFGTEPDAKILALASKLREAGRKSVLDIGAGTGRNALALARLGHSVDAVELTPRFAEILTATAQQTSLNVRVIWNDVFATRSELRGPYHLILVSEVISDFRTVEQLNSLFELAAQQLAPDGFVVFNIFVSKAHYSADDAAKEFSQQVYSFFYTPEEVNAASRGLPLQKVSDECVHDYEKANLPAGIWPPTGW